MNRVFLCLTTEHDLRLVAVAGVVCLLSTIVGYDLLARAVAERRAIRFSWLAAAALVTGGGVWATHFIAMLAYDPGVPLGFAVATTLGSGVGGIVLAGVGFVLIASAPKSPVVRVLSGAVIGGGVAMLHYVGMAAVVLQGTIVWDDDLVASSVIGGCALAALSTWQFTGGARIRQRLLAAVTLTLAVCFHHFVGMGAVTIIQDVSRPEIASALPKSAIVMGVTGAMLAVLALGAISGTFDRTLASRSAQEAQRLSTLANVAFEGIVVCRDGCVVQANQSFAKLVGREADDLVGLPLAQFFAEADRYSVAALMGGVGKRVISARVETASADLIPAEILTRVIEERGGRQIVVAVRDLRERPLAENRIRFLAHHDTLTGLANRGFFGVRLEEEIAKARRSGSLLAVHYVDLDRFKEVNDALGHLAGDEVLRTVAGRLQALARKSDVIARLGGDEFVLLQTEVGSPDAAVALAERVCRSLGKAISPNGERVEVSASVGVALFPADSDTSEGLIRAADMALYRAKNEGRATFRCFEP
ncbi:MAG: diguanylate cyclase, partial [Methylobacteriaceae bacterium]|nr:diguanylate cyclase [Methylobacteriaceae bacterium]